MSAAAPRIELSAVSLGYKPGSPVLSGVSGDLRGPGLLRLDGGNGSGKSTIMEGMAGHLRPQSGVIRVNGSTALRGRHEGVVLVRTSPALVAGMTVRDHCLLFAGGRRERLERISRFTAELGLGEFLDHVPSQLSSGTRRKLWVALGLVRTTPVLLLDEPFNELDAAATGWLFSHLVAEARSRLVLLVCHTWVPDWPLQDVTSLGSGLRVMQVTPPSCAATTPTPARQGACA